jgi:hypothetical protein
MITATTIDEIDKRNASGGTFFRNRHEGVRAAILKHWRTHNPVIRRPIRRQGFMRAGIMIFGLLLWRML